MPKRDPQFREIGPKEWSGRYKRIPGEDTTFHVRDRKIQCLWQRDQQVRSYCDIVDSRAARELARAVLEGKRFFGYSGGGSFLINEHGQVLVPSPAGDGRQAFVGEWTGSLLFADPWTDQVFDLADDEGLKLGDPWPWPYIGMPHNLSKRSVLYFWDSLLRRKVTPPRQDRRLIDGLRRLRPRGPVRFVTMPGGFALTKVPHYVGDGRTVDQVRYVGRLDFSCWFPQEG